MSHEQQSLFEQAPSAPAARPDIEREVEVLRAQIRQANHEYYNLAEPSLSDAEYDALWQRLRTLEASHPDLQRHDSPTRLVGAPLERSPFRKVVHVEPMLSLANAFDTEQLNAWAERESILTGKADELFAELKIDGLSLELIYEHGELRRAALRGDGEEGDDVTSNAKTIPDIPHRLKGAAVPERVAVRGEVYMTRSGLEALNAERSRQGEPTYSNPRNTAAGSLRQLDPNVTAARPLSFYAYSIVSPNGEVLVRTQEESYGVLKRWGFSVCALHRVCATTAEIEAFVAEVAELRPNLNYDIDGVVVKVNEIARQRRLGAVDSEPRWAIARKWPAEAKPTRLLSISIQVGKSGVQTPVAELEPVELNGAVVRRATLHNENYIRALGLKLGDRVLVTRAGEVIPKVIGVDTDARTGEEIAWDFPAECASCQSPLRRDIEGGKADHYCHNPECNAQLVRRLEHFASRGAMEIRGLGGEVAQRLVDQGLVRSVADLYDLNAATLATLEGFAETSARNLAEAIQATRAKPFSRVLHGLGIPYVGERTAEQLAEHFGTMAALASADVGLIAEVEGVGETTATAVRGFLHSPETRQMIERLTIAGLQMEDNRRTRATDGPLAGKTVVVTGTLERYTREGIRQVLRDAGAKVTGSVSAKTDLLVCGAKAGSKEDAARKLGVRIISEADLEDLLNQE